MKIFSRRTLTILVALAVCLNRASAEDKLDWQSATAFTIEGRGWRDTAGPYDRLPDSAKSKVNSTAWDQSKDSSGIVVRFNTDADSVGVRWSLTKPELDMPHMPATGCSGLDLYARSGGKEWRFIGNCRPAQQDANQAKIEFADGAKTGRECMLYLPLYNGTKSLEIGVAPGKNLTSPAVRPEERRKPIVVYGTSITQGGCASRPGMNWTSILGRLLDRPVINLGFSASGDMKPPVGELLAELDPAVYVIDCAWNMGDSQEVYYDRTTDLVQSLRKVHSSIPIIFVGQSLMRPEAHPTDLTKRQAFAVEKLQMEGMKGLTMVPGTDLIGTDGEGTVDGVHYNDIGMQRQARAIYNVITKTLDESTH